MATVPELNRLARDLYESRDSAGSAAVTEYAEAKLGMLAQRLMTCTAEELGGLQGEARAYRELLKAINTAPFDIDDAQTRGR